VSCGTDQAWLALAEALGHPEWLTDPRFRTLLDRKRNEDNLEHAIAEATRVRDRTELVAQLRSAGVPAAPVNSSADILTDPDLVARGYWRRVNHPVIGELAIARPPFRYGATPIALRRPPLLGEHTAEVARELLGLSDDEIARLVADGVMA
jgi:crotonobetainyl-CoA:carnitine CoA-transferase CaiB-like acyl-CoA transferase